MSKTFSFTVPYARTRKHRTHKSVKITTLEVVANTFPVGMPRGANPRETNTDKKVYQEVKDSLLGIDGSHPGTFDLKHRGVTIIADDITLGKQGTDDLVTLTFNDDMPDEAQGVVDGGHSTELVEMLLTEGLAIPDDQSIMFEVITGLHTVPNSVVVDIAKARNSSTQVAMKSLMNLGNHFDFLKDALGPASDHIAWVENDAGTIDVTDLVATMSCFDTVTYPDRSTHPLDAERRKKSMLDRLDKDPDIYKRLVPLLDDILHLSEFIVHDAEERYGEGQDRNGWSSLGYVRKKPVSHTFLCDDGGEPLVTEKPMPRAALLPVLAAFRFMVEDNTDAERIGDYYPAKWKTSYTDVLKVWNEIGGQMLHIFREGYSDARQDASAAARTASVWDRCYMEVLAASMG